MTDQNDITYGYGTILWAKAIRSDLGYLLVPAGWVFPGGARTTDRERALKAAMSIHEEFVRAGKRPVRFVNPHNVQQAA